MATGYMVHCFNQPHHHHFSFELVGTDATTLLLWRLLLILRLHLIKMQF